MWRRCSTTASSTAPTAGRASGWPRRTCFSEPSADASGSPRRAARRGPRIPTSASRSPCSSRPTRRRSRRRRPTAEDFFMRSIPRRRRVVRYIRSPKKKKTTSTRRRPCQPQPRTPRHRPSTATRSTSSKTARGPSLLAPPKEAFLRKSVIARTAGDLMRRVIRSKLTKVCGAAKVFEYDTVEQAMSAMERAPPAASAVVSIDHNLQAKGGRLTGSEMIQFLVAARFAGVIVSASGDDAAAHEHRQLGAHVVLGKPLPTVPVIRDAIALGSVEAARRLRRRSNSAPV
mmetsp:Transcript_12707/g.51054  ORF Transcript_12707/g.51054 Transcript_12707/m.51054 type:complete len:287 (+) Transcript_12707:1792-2652(+)